MKYIDFVDLSYEPREDEVVCDFYVEPEGLSIEEAEDVAAESSMGTWTEVGTMKPYVTRLHATVFSGYI